MAIITQSSIATYSIEETAETYVITKIGHLSNVRVINNLNKPATSLLKICLTI